MRRALIRILQLTLLLMPFLLCFPLLAGDTPLPTQPLAAYAISASDAQGNLHLRGVIIQIDATHAVLGIKDETNGIVIVDGEAKQGAVPLIPLEKLFKLGESAQMKAGISVACGAPDPQI